MDDKERDLVVLINMSRERLCLGDHVFGLNSYKVMCRAKLTNLLKGAIKSTKLKMISIDDPAAISFKRQRMSPVSLKQPVETIADVEQKQDEEIIEEVPDVPIREVPEKDVQPVAKEAEDDADPPTSKTIGQEQLSILHQESAKVLGSIDTSSEIPAKKKRGRPKKNQQKNDGSLPTSTEA